MNRYTIIFPLIFLFLTYCLLGSDKLGAGTNSTSQKNVTSINTTINIDEEIKRIKGILISNPNNYEAHYNLAVLYEKKFMLDEAFSAYKKAALLNPSSEDPLIGQGRILNKKSNYYEAVSMLEKAFRNNQDRMEIYYYLGLAYAKTGNPDNAIILWQGAIDKSKDKSNTYYLKGLIQKQKGDFETAEALLKNAITINPEFAAAHMVLEALYSLNGRYGDAYRHAEIHRKTKQHLQSNNTEEQVASVSKNKIPHSSNGRPEDVYSQAEIHTKTKQHLQSNNTEEQVASISKDKSPQNKPNNVSQKDTTEIVTEQTKTVSINGINDAINNTEKQVTSISKDKNPYSSNGRSGQSNRQVVMSRKTKQHLQSNNTEKQVASISKNRNPQNRSNSVSQKDTTEMVTEQTEILSINGFNDAINYSGKTRMLSMRIAKLYGIQVLKNYPVDKKQKAKKDLNDTKKIANKIYKALLAFPPASANTEVNKAIKESQAYWYQMEKILSKEPTKEAFSAVLDMSDNMLEKNNTMTKYLESLAPYAQSELIDIAGRQRTNSMKLARDYLAASMDIHKARHMDSMFESAALFNNDMLTLEDASVNTSEIKGLIKSITNMEWQIVYETVNKCVEDNGTKFNVLTMINFCEKLLIKTDRLTKLYVGISNYDTKT